MIRLKAKNLRAFFSILLIMLLLALVVIMCIDLLPLLEFIAENAANEKAVTSDIINLGAKGVIIIAALQALQVITAFFPAAAVQILSGLVYGIVLGTLICLAGNIIGNTIVFVILRQVDKTFDMTTPNFTLPRKKRRLDFSCLRDSDNAAFMAFALYLLPGMPNGILPYIFAKTKISLPRYLLSVTLAGVPSILICSYMGERLAAGDIFTAVLVFFIRACIALFVVLSRDRIVTLLSRK